MNVYDFDNTIFCPDSSFLFITSTLKKHPRWFTSNLHSYLQPITDYISNNDVSPLKECYFSFLKYIPDVDEYVNHFWDENIHRLEQWYLNQRQDSDVIISASPEFLLKPLADRIGFNLIATKIDKYSGNIQGANNKGIEKVNRFSELYSLDDIDCFYTDSISDLPLAKYARRAYMVKNHVPVYWNLD